MEIVTLTGHHFGQSELRELIAIGASSAVYRGYHSGLQKTVAVKVLLPELVSDGFLDAIKTAAQLEHAHILPIHEYGIEHDLGYITMRLVAGYTLAERRAWSLENNRSLPSLRETAVFFRQVALTLDYVHRSKLQHGDIKPSNIIFDAEGTAFFTDFGIGALKKTAPVDDRFALAATIASLLGDPLPFDVTDPGRSIGDHLDEFTAVLRTRYPDAADIMLPVFERAFATDPAERFPTALECSKAFDPVRPLPGPPNFFFSVYMPRVPLSAALQPQDKPTPKPVVVAESPKPAKSRRLLKVVASGLLGVVTLLIIGGMLLTLPDENISSSAQVTSTPNATIVSLAASGIPRNSDWTPVEREINNVPMVEVPAGCFRMGKDNPAGQFETPAHEVCLSSFWIAKTEVTNAQYRLCVDAGVCDPPSDRTHFDDPEYDDYPVTFVHWAQANTFAEWVGGTLPTDAQWEYAARGPEGLLYAWGDEHDSTRLNLCDTNCPHENKDGAVDDGYPQAAPVGSFPGGVSWVGALDLAGNVWEWSADWYAPYADASQIDPTGPDNGDKRVLRGGSWANNLDAARATFRMAAGPVVQQNHVGFRIVIPGE